ncbi:MAG TPA: hypothetical protein VH372_23360 [Actinospica sp.]|jgi:hypothetical protein|nr:hypothetical protein [Actinospica sp.]
MTENTTTTGGADSEESETEFVALGSPDEEEAALPEELIEIDDDGADEDDVPGTGTVSGGFGFAGLALAIVSLTTSWTSGVVTTHAQYNEEVHAPSTGLTGQQTLDMYANGWHTQAWWALVFAAAAVLFGAGSLLSPSILLSGKTPGWAKAASTAALIVGVIGAILAILTVTGVIGGHLTAPAATSSSTG